MRAITANHYPDNCRSMSFDEESEPYSAFLEDARAGKMIDVVQIKNLQEKLQGTLLEVGRSALYDTITVKEGHAAEQTSKESTLGGDRSFEKFMKVFLRKLALSIRMSIYCWPAVAVWHKSAALKMPSDITIQHIPPGTSEMNLIEQIL